MNVIEAMKDTVECAMRVNGYPRHGPLGLEHLIEMRDRMMAGNMSYGKLCRWLGWAQAAIVANGVATLEMVKAINKCHADEGQA